MGMALGNERPAVVGHDYTECMMALMRYPGAGDVMKLADSAFAVRDAVLTPRETARKPLAASSAAQPVQVRRGGDFIGHRRTV
jgi:hypothetical protein